MLAPRISRRDSVRTTRTATSHAKLAAAQYDPTTSDTGTIDLNEPWALDTPPGTLAAVGAVHGEGVEVDSTLGRHGCGLSQLVEGGLITEPMAALEARWRATITPLFVGLDLPMPPAGDLGGGRTIHGEPFRWLWGEFTSVRRSDPGAIW